MQGRRKQLSALVLALLSLALIIIAAVDENAKAQVARICTEAKTSLFEKTFGLAETRSQAKAFFVYDFTDSAVLAQKNADAALPLASLTKLMTLRVALSRESLDQLYTVRPDDLTSEASIGFAPGQTYRVRDLAKAALIASSNNGAEMLAHSTGMSEDAFIATMNVEAGRLGLSSLKYASVTGLDADHDTQATAWGSAKDIVMLLHRDQADFPEAIAFSTIGNATIADTAGETIEIQNTDKALPSLPLLVASKTGYTDVAGGNLAIVWKDASGHLLGAAVLGSTETGRFSDMIKLHDSAGDFLGGLSLLSNSCS